MPQQGGGCTWHEGVNTYIDLIVNDLSEIEKEYPQTFDLFTALAKHRQGASNFGYAELAKDKRLFNLLSKTSQGRNFYKKIESNIPLLTISNKILGDVNNLQNVQIFPLSRIEENPLEALEEIKNAAQLTTDTDKKDFFDWIESLNKIISLKPGFFGLSVDINAIINAWLKYVRSKHP